MKRSSQTTTIPSYQHIVTTPGKKSAQIQLRKLAQRKIHLHNKMLHYQDLAKIASSELKHVDAKMEKLTNKVGAE